MTLPSPIPEPMIEPIAARFQLLGDPTRLKIIDLLRRRGAASVGQIGALIGASQQNVSKHLGLLYRAELLRRRKDGNRVLYSIADRSVIDACEALYPVLAARQGYGERGTGEPRWAGQPNVAGARR